MRLFLFLILFCFSSSSLAGLNSSDQTVLDIDSASQSVWRVMSRSLLHIGTGFFIGPNPKYFITNFHVIQYLLRDSKIEDLVLLHDAFPYLKVKKVLALSAYYDLALLEIEGEKLPPSLRLREDLTNLNEGLVILGYPSGIGTQINKISEFLPFTPKHIFEFLVDHSDLHGASGSPVLDNKGQVVGVAYRSVYNVLHSINLSALKRFVSRQEGQDCENLGIKECMRKTLDNLEEVAEQGDARAQYELGSSLIQTFDEQDIYKGYKLIEESAQKGYFLAQHTMANVYIRRREDFQNLNWLEKALWRTNPYFWGEKQGWKRAFEWMEEAAKQDHALAQYHLGLMYAIGKEQNLDEAQKWIEKSARQGYFPAREKLGYAPKPYKEIETKVFPKVRDHSLASEGRIPNEDIIPIEEHWHLFEDPPQFSEKVSSPRALPSTSCRKTIRSLD